MIRKIKYIVSIVLVLSIILIIVIIKKHNTFKESSIELREEIIVDYEEMELRKNYYKGGEGVMELLLPLAEKNGNWEHYPLKKIGTDLNIFYTIKTLKLH